MQSSSGLVINGGITATGGLHMSGNAVSPWYRLYHCADAPDASPAYSASYLHVRTPFPIEWTLAGAFDPSILEVVGFHTYSGEYRHDFKATINVASSSNNLTANVLSDTGNSYIRIYASDNTYGGYKRLCFAVNKLGCCCVGWIWIRFWNKSNLWNHYAWATTGGATGTSNYF